MYVLDTDTYSQFLRGHTQIKRRILEKPPGSIHLSVITPEEILRGRLDGINSARKQKSTAVSAAYDYFLGYLAELEKREYEILPYDAAAEAAFRAWPPVWKQAGSQDCRIAAVAYVHQFTVVTCNTRHFSKITAVKIEDWSLG